MQDFRKLVVWRRAQELCLEVYRLSAAFPKEETYGITAQLRRAGISVGSNIAEASKRASRPDKIRVLNIAQGEAAEVASILDVADRLGFAVRETIRKLADDYDGLGGGLEALRQRVRSQKS